MDRKFLNFFLYSLERVPERSSFSPKQKERNSGNANGNNTKPQVVEL